MNIPFSLIGSEDLHNQVVQDIDILLEAAGDHKFVPVMLSVGTLFVEIASAQTVVSDYSIDNWEVFYKKDPEAIIAYFKEKKKEIYDMCLKRLGKLGEDDKRQIKIYFDPDEPYMMLTCIDKNKKAKDNEPRTVQGYPICILRFKPEEILPDYKFDLS